jgi:hypothetical protein
MRPSVIFAVNGRSPYPGQVLGGVDEGDVGEGLRKVADQTLGFGGRIPWTRGQHRYKDLIIGSIFKLIEK